MILTASGVVVPGDDISEQLSRLAKLTPRTADTVLRPITESQRQVVKKTSRQCFSGDEISTYDLLQRKARK